MPDNYIDLPDAALVSLTLLEKQDAYAELVRRYQKMVLYVAWRGLGNRSLAEEVAQDAFVAAWSRLDSLHQPEKFGPWVCRIAANHAKNTARREMLGMAQVTAGDDAAALSERQDYHMWQEQQAEEATRDSLREMLDRMSEKVRTIIELHYWEGLSVSEIALQLSIPQGTVNIGCTKGENFCARRIVCMTKTERKGRQWINL